MGELTDRAKRIPSDIRRRPASWTLGGVVAVLSAVLLLQNMGIIPKLNNIATATETQTLKERLREIEKGIVALNGQVAALNQRFTDFKDGFRAGENEGRRRGR